MTMPKKSLQKKRVTFVEDALTENTENIQQTEVDGVAIQPSRFKIAKAKMTQQLRARKKMSARPLQEVSARMPLHNELHPRLKRSASFDRTYSTPVNSAMASFIGDGDHAAGPPKLNICHKRRKKMLGIYNAEQTTKMQLGLAARFAADSLTDSSMTCTPQIVAQPDKQIKTGPSLRLQRLHALSLASTSSKDSFVNSPLSTLHRQRLSVLADIASSNRNSLLALSHRYDFEGHISVDVDCFNGSVRHSMNCDQSSQSLSRCRAISKNNLLSDSKTMTKIENECQPVLPLVGNESHAADANRIASSDTLAHFVSFDMDQSSLSFPDKHSELPSENISGLTSPNFSTQQSNGQLVEQNDIKRPFDQISEDVREVNTSFDCSIKHSPKRRRGMRFEDLIRECQCEGLYPYITRVVSQFMRWLRGTIYD